MNRSCSRSVYLSLIDVTFDPLSSQAACSCQLPKGALEASPSAHFEQRPQRFCVSTKSCWWFASGARKGLRSLRCKRRLEERKRRSEVTKRRGCDGARGDKLWCVPAWHPYIKALWPSYLQRQRMTLFMKSDSAMSMEGLTSTCQINAIAISRDWLFLWCTVWIWNVTDRTTMK